MCANHIVMRRVSNWHSKVEVCITNPMIAVLQTLTTTSRPTQHANTLTYYATKLPLWHPEDEAWRKLTVTSKRLKLWSNCTFSTGSLLAELCFTVWAFRSVSALSCFYSPNVKTDGDPPNLLQTLAPDRNPARTTRTAQFGGNKVDRHQTIAA